jgi:hypothetical protein
MFSARYSAFHYLTHMFQVNRDAEACLIPHARHACSASGSRGAGAGSGGHGDSPMQPRAYFATSSSRRGADGADGNGRDTLLTRDEESTMISSFRAGIRHSGWLHKLVGKTPQDINWKRYWVSAGSSTHAVHMFVPSSMGST